MASTTNYNWSTPDDTALVKDGAAAIRTLGSSIDTTTKALNPSTTLGDIEYRSSTANTNTRLGIGTTGQVLTVAGGVPSWATPSAVGTYTSFAPVVTQSGTVTSTSSNGSYTTIGNFVHWYGRIQITGSGTANNEISISIPVEWTGGQNPEFSGTAQFYDTSSGNFFWCEAYLSTSAYKLIFFPTSSVGVIPLGASGNTVFSGAVANGDVLSFSIVYRKA
jgi:hypothetical protein